MSNFFENIYGVLIEPDETFENIVQRPSVYQGAACVATVSGMLYILKLQASFQISNLFSLAFSILSALFLWFIIGTFFSFIEKSKTATFLTLSGFALIPYIFLCPLSLLDLFGEYLSPVSGMLKFAVCIWAFVLFFKALQKAYNLDFSRAFLLLTIPFVAWVIMFFWIINFFVGLSYIFNF